MKKWLAAGLLALSSVMGACAADPIDDVTQNTSEVTAPANRCCQSGYLTCSTNANVLEEYELPGCGTTRPTARAACVQQCGHACVDHGFAENGTCPEPGPDGPDGPGLPDPFPTKSL
jgi:hypothetical protein